MATRGVWGIGDSLVPIALAALHRAHQPKDRSLECELKFRVPGPDDHERLEQVLRELGAEFEGTYDEENLRFNGPGKSTRQTSLRLRLLNGGPTGVLTAKGPATFVRGMKIREETEVAVDDAHAMLDMLEALGFAVAFSYRKHRATWLLDGAAVTVDTLDAGWFVEVEGSSETIEDSARKLGLDPKEAVKDSYSAIAKRHLDALKKKSRRR